VRGHGFPKKYIREPRSKAKHGKKKKTAAIPHNKKRTSGERGQKTTKTTLGKGVCPNQLIWWSKDGGIKASAAGQKT